MSLDLLERDGGGESAVEVLRPDVVLLRGFAMQWEPAILAAVDGVARQAPFRHMVTPGGFRMSVAMTNCGELGWVSDRDRKSVV